MMMPILSTTTIYITLRIDTQYEDASTQHNYYLHNDTQHTDTKNIDTQHEDASTQHNYYLHNDTQHTDSKDTDTHEDASTQHNYLHNDTQHTDSEDMTLSMKTPELSITTIYIMTLSIPTQRI